MKMSAIALVALVAAAGAARAATVQVTLTGVRPSGGHILAALQTRGQFMKREAAAGVVLPGASKGDVRFSLKGVTPGDYALSVLQDADDDKDMTFSPDGQPREGWTMVNAAAVHAKPTFDQVRVHVPAGGASLTLPMVYPAAR